MFGKFDDRLDDFAAGLVCELNRAEHDFFRKLLGFGFNHHHRVISRCNNQIEFTLSNLFVGRVEDIFAVQITYACAADWAHERHTGKRHCSRCGNHRKHIRLIFAVIAQHLRDAVDFVVKAFWEQWT